MVHDEEKVVALSKCEVMPSRALEDRVAVLEANTDNSSNESLFADKKLKDNNRNNPALDKKRKVPDRAMQTLDSQGC